MNRLDRALLFSKYLYHDAYERIMNSKLLNDSEKEILSKENFIARISGQPFYFPEEHNYKFNLKVLSKAELGYDTMVALCRNVCIITDPHLEELYEQFVRRKP